MVILEDDQFLAHCYEMLLQRVSPHVQILSFTDGDKAWGELSKVDPDLFITDVEHPGRDVWEMLSLLTAEKVTYPILMVSGDFVPRESYQHMYPALKLTTISKPFDVPVFIKLLTDLLKATDGYMGITEQTRPNHTQGGATGLA